MGTKNNPDEPIFVLRATDPSAPGLVERWVRDRERREGPSDRTREGYKTAQAMRRYYCAAFDWGGDVPEIPFDPRYRRRPDHERREFEPRRRSTGAHTYIGAGVIERRILNSERRKAENSNQARRQGPTDRRDFDGDPDDRVSSSRRGPNLGRRDPFRKDQRKSERRVWDEEGKGRHRGDRFRRFNVRVRSGERRRVEVEVPLRGLKDLPEFAATGRRKSTDERRMYDAPGKKLARHTSIVVTPKEERVEKERRGPKEGRRKSGRLSFEIPASLNRRRRTGRRHSTNDPRRMTDGAIADRWPLVETIRNIPPTLTQAGTTLFERFPDRRITTESRRGERFSRRGYGNGDRLGHIAHLGRRLSHFDRRHK